MAVRLPKPRAASKSCSISLDLAAKIRLKSPRQLAGALLYGRPNHQAANKRSAQGQDFKTEKTRISVRQGWKSKARSNHLAGFQRHKFRESLCLSLHKIGMNLTWAEGQMDKGWRDKLFKG